MSYFKNGTSAEVLEENNYYPFGLKHEGYNPTAENLSYQYKYNGVELQQESGMYAMDWRSYMPELGRFSGMDMLSESYSDSTPYHFALNNPVFYSDPTGMYTNTHNGYLFTDTAEIAALQKYFGESGGSVSNLGGFMSGNETFKEDIPEVVMQGQKGTSSWDASSYNRAILEGGILNALQDFNFRQNWSNYYTAEQNSPNAQSIKSFEKFLFIGVPLTFAGGELITVGNAALGSYGSFGAYAQGAILRGATDAALQKTIKGSIDWKQTGINSIIGGGSGGTAIKIGWVNFVANMSNNIYTSSSDGKGLNGIYNDRYVNGAKIFTGIMGMSFGNYNGLTNGYLGGYFGTTLLPGVYFNTTDVVIEQNKNKK